MDRFLHVHRRPDMALLQFLLEGYEGLLTVMTADAHAAIVKISIMAGFHDDVECILHSLRGLLSFEEILTYSKELRDRDVIR
jgi:hypothetical protein